ncbi:MAG TPA: hypothetical protein VJ602_00525 [Paludibacter sp.]|nr:hypothetical protein [Paludibacter sp.]
MEIVPTSTSKKKEVGLEELLLRKAELKQQIQDQQLIITSSTRKLFSPASLSSYVFGSVQKSLNLVDGFLIGYKIVRTIKRFIRKFR